MTSDELDPRLVSLLRNVPPIDDEVRDRHVALAIAEMPHESSRSAPRRVAVAAAGLLILGAGFTLGASREDRGGIAAENNAVVEATDTVKGSSNAMADTCSAEGRTVLTEYSSRGRVRIIALDTNPDRIVVRDAQDCSTVTEVELP